MTDWAPLATIGGLIVAGLAINAWLTRSGDKTLSIREHEEYKDQERQKAILRDRIVELTDRHFQREVDWLKSQVDKLWKNGS